MSQEKNSKKNKSRLLFGLAVFFGLVFLPIALVFAFEIKYQNKIYPGVLVHDLDLSGKTINEARETLHEAVEKFNENDLVFIFEKENDLVYSSSLSFTPDLIKEIVIFDIDGTLGEAYRFGRTKNIVFDFKNKISAVLENKIFPIKFIMNEEKIKEHLKKSFAEFETPAVDTALFFEVVAEQEEEKIIFSLKSEESGVVIDYDKSLKTLKENLSKLSSSPVYLDLVFSFPKIKKDECEKAMNKAEELIGQSPFSLYAQASSSDPEIFQKFIKDLPEKHKTWEIEQTVLASWLTLFKDQEQEVKIKLDQEIVKDFLQNTIASSTNIEAVSGKFEMSNGKVKEFQPSQNGFFLDLEKTYEEIEENLFSASSSKIDLIYRLVPAEIITGDANDLGITEIVGTGHSNFAGSPANRRHNIKIGSEKLNGLIIKPDEEFSLVKALGRIDASTGYLPELVIKGNETIPEYGGGLCQVATTIFRSAIYSGLPITERRAHAYRVSYYEPAGMDAAIYVPKPDVRFINDTGNNILIQARFRGNDMYFDFWGTKDNREVSVENPVIYNIRSAPPTKIIETFDLAPGEKKCIEKAHAGADAHFDYKVVYSDGETKEQRFTSRYVPWQAVCLLGVKKASEEKKEEIKEEEKEETKKEEEPESSEVKPFSESKKEEPKEEVLEQEENEVKPFS